MTTATEELNLKRHVDKLSKKERRYVRLQEWYKKVHHGEFLREAISTEKHYK